ncbi:MAG TPA: SDR family oxidoreductase [Dehalococcoidia bacterium]|nr:SDR family oxidoreductase [Dehalococcoidia bacterium]
MDKVVVTGGAGFMGSHTADELTRRGYHVLVFDQTESPWLHSDQEMMIGDVLDPKSLAMAMKGARYVYHFAGIADIEESRSRPVETMNLNVMGASLVVEAARQSGVERVIFASTMYVYSPFGSFYRASKQAAETIIEAYQQEYALDYTFLRYGSLYGPRAQDWNGLRKYVQQVVEGGQITYAGTGEEKREYIHVYDAARLSVDVLDDKHRNRAITVTGSQILSSKEMMDLIFEIAGKKSDIVLTDTDRKGYHYNLTPYRYTPKQAFKLVPSEFIDIGQGVLELVKELHEESQ